MVEYTPPQQIVYENPSYPTFAEPHNVNNWGEGMKTIPDFLPIDNSVIFRSSKAEATAKMLSFLKCSSDLNQVKEGENSALRTQYDGFSRLGKNNVDLVSSPSNLFEREYLTRRINTSVFHLPMRSNRTRLNPSPSTSYHNKYEEPFMPSL